MAYLTRHAACRTPLLRDGFLALALRHLCGSTAPLGGSGKGTLSLDNAGSPNTQATTPTCARPLSPRLALVSALDDCTPVVTVRAVSVTAVVLPLLAAFNNFLSATSTDNHVSVDVLGRRSRPHRHHRSCANGASAGTGGRDDAGRSCDASGDPSCPVIEDASRRRTAGVPQPGPAVPPAVPALRMAAEVGGSQPPTDVEECMGQEERLAGTMAIAAALVALLQRPDLIGPSSNAPQPLALAVLAAVRNTAAIVTASTLPAPVVAAHAGFMSGPPPMAQAFVEGGGLDALREWLCWPGLLGEDDDLGESGGEGESGSSEVEAGDEEGAVCGTDDDAGRRDRCGSDNREGDGSGDYDNDEGRSGKGDDRRRSRRSCGCKRGCRGGDGDSAAKENMVAAALVETLGCVLTAVMQAVVRMCARATL